MVHRHVAELAADQADLVIRALAVAMLVRLFVAHVMFPFAQVFGVDGIVDRLYRPAPGSQASGLEMRRSRQKLLPEGTLSSWRSTPDKGRCPMSTALANETPKAAPEAQLARPATFAVVLFGREVIVPASAQTLDGFRTWTLSAAFPERGQFSFLDGEVFIDMNPEELETHNKVKTELGRVLGTLNKKSKLGSFYSDGVLLTNEKAKLSTEPDALFVTRESLEAGRVQRVPRKGEDRQFTDLVGSPDWVLEVVSDSSVRKDTQRLRQEYHRAGIGEYWLIDARGEEIDFQILLGSETDYEAAVAQKGWLTSPLFRRRFRSLHEEERWASWDYTLEVKPVR